MRKKIIIILFIFLYLFLPKNNWAQNNTPKTSITSSVENNYYTNNLNVLLDLLKLFFSAGDKTFNDIKVTPDTSGYVYYSQCQGPYDNYPLPQGGTLCSAGCGPTTVAMILASFVDNNINPKTVVEIYKESGYYLGSQGSRYFDAKKIFDKYNLKTATIYANRAITVAQLMNQYGLIIKNYQNSGWTFFTLANFCDGGCGHFFWTIKIDDGLNILAYDPAYDISLPKPINHKKRYPFPKIRVLIGVKK